MKKLIFRRFSLDIAGFFLLAIISIGLIVWIIQAVNYLDFVSEDGHSLKVYFMYSVLSLPKIIGKLTIFVFFISVFFIISKYEDKNEMIVFWTSGVKKIEFINNLFKISLLLLFFQLFFNLFLIPKSQDTARSFLRNSEIDFFPSLIKSKKFIDTVSDLTIFIDNKDNSGIFENIYIQDNSNKEKTQVVLAKNGLLGKKNDNIFLILYSGKILNIDSKKTSIVNFEKTEFNLSRFSTKTILFPKIQEQKTSNLIKCLNSYYKYNKTYITKLFRCEESVIDSISQEMYKRSILPFYILIVTFVAGLLIIKSKNDFNYSKFKFITFIIGVALIIFSEISIELITEDILKNSILILFPLIVTFVMYYYLKSKSKFINS
tara:strand:- start:378 stop:1502 length:1125 start_codon:yes stop_codon:yes gene_type:complete